MTRRRHHHPGPASLWHALGADRRGAAAIEVAVAVGVLMLVTMGGLDYGLAYTYQMGLGNAAWAGTELARARRLALGPGVEPDHASASLATVREAVIGASRSLDPAPGADQIEIGVTCFCPGGSDGGAWFDCPPGAVAPPSCGTVQTFIQVTLRVPYTLMFPWPGLDRAVTLSASNVVRLN